jgi:hypothetical protein
VIPLKNYRIAGEPYGIEPTRADSWAGVPTVRQITLDFEAFVNRWKNGGKTDSGCD